MRKIIPAVAAGVTALAVAGGTFGYVTLDKAVALSIDGDVAQVQTMAPTVVSCWRSRASRSVSTTWSFPGRIPGWPRAPRSP